MYIIVTTKDNVVDDLYEEQTEELAHKAFLDECRAINDEFDKLDSSEILDEGYYVHGIFGVTLWNLFF